MPSKIPVRRFEDILGNIDRIKKYTRGISYDAFIKDEKTLDAVERCLARISEAASKLEGAAETLIPDQRWSGFAPSETSYDTNTIVLTRRLFGTLSTRTWAR